MRVQALLCLLDYLLLPPTIQEDHANGHPNPDCHPSFEFGFWVFGCDPYQLSGASPSLRSWAGVVEDKSCTVDVEDEMLPKLADKLGRTSGTKLSVLQKIAFLSLANRGL